MALQHGLYQCQAQAHAGDAWMAAFVQALEGLEQMALLLRRDARALALSRLDDAVSVKAFLQDLCTPAELEAMTDRWRVVPLLLSSRCSRSRHSAIGRSAVRRRPLRSTQV